jgi:hypothetical protein
MPVFLPQLPQIFRGVIQRFLLGAFRFGFREGTPFGRELFVHGLRPEIRIRFTHSAFAFEHRAVIEAEELVQFCFPVLEEDLLSLRAWSSAKSSHIVTIRFSSPISSWLR